VCASRLPAGPAPLAARGLTAVLARPYGRARAAGPAGGSHCAQRQRANWLNVSYELQLGRQDPLSGERATRHF
jgi:hypothetical protein